MKWSRADEVDLMTAHRNTARRRFAAALDVLRGRRPRFDYGVLLVMPFIAAAGGVLISLVIENAVERRRAHGAGLDASRRADGALLGEKPGTARSTHERDQATTTFTVWRFQDPVVRTARRLGVARPPAQQHRGDAVKHFHLAPGQRLDQ
jgi:hypothetical protein